MCRAVPTLLCVAALAVFPGIASAKGVVTEPEDGPDPRGLTVSGSGAALVTAPARLSEGSVRRAVEAVKPRAMARALAEARTRAERLAAVAGVALGDVQAITEREPGADIGFSQQRYCSTRRPSRCQVPLMRTVSVTVTFATAQTSEAAAGGPVLVADGIAQTPVRPRNRRSSASIRAALASARAAADPAALRATTDDAAALARASGLRLGTVLAIAEVRRPYEDPGLGSFGPGRFCGNVRRAITRRDPATGRRRVVRRVTQRRCFFSSSVTVAFRVTIVAA